MTGKEQTKGCDRHWIPLTGVRILGVVCLMLIGGFGSAAAAASYLGSVAVVASNDSKRLFVANSDAGQVAPPVLKMISGDGSRWWMLRRGEDSGRLAARNLLLGWALEGGRRGGFARTKGVKEGGMF
ncbi:MAG: hypothetical protein OSA84_12505 [Akkermansiaceae bacterium]|nr:hypothetical protein [Akkermansiaceae bacterium]